MYYIEKYFSGINYIFFNRDFEMFFLERLKLIFYVTFRMKFYMLVLNVKLSIVILI